MSFSFYCSSIFFRTTAAKLPILPLFFVFFLKNCVFLPKIPENNKDLQTMAQGKTNNPNGRPRGTANKATTETRQFLNNLLKKNQKQIIKDLKELEPKDRLNILEKFMQYTTPKMASVAQTIEFENFTDEQINDFVSRINIGDNER